MKLQLVLPDNCRAERRWAADVVLGEFLGIDFDISFRKIGEALLTANGRTLELDDGFFALASRHWLSERSLPVEPPRLWQPASQGLQARLVAPEVPVLFGDGGFALTGDGDAVLRLDVFGSAFFMLSRYEEAVRHQRDQHGRFPAAASLAFRAGFLDRPIIDEYTEILWSAMKTLWPQLQRKERAYRTVVSCDVDHPYHPSVGSLPRLLKRMAGEVARGRGIVKGMALLRNYVVSRRGDWRSDPYYFTVDWMMDVNEKAGNKVAFYFIPEITDPVRDDTCPIDDAAVKAMMKRIAERGHEIGIHPGYHTYEDPVRMQSAKRRLDAVLAQQDIALPVSGGRQHYLRWSPRTPALWEAAGLAYDSTLSYADYPGFRCGTCHEYPMYDLHGRRALQVRQRPLVCMELSVIRDLGHGLTEAALRKMESLKAAARRVNGDFTLLWHNSHFEDEGAREMYCHIIA